MEYNRQLIEKIFFEQIIPQTKKGYIEIPIFDPISKVNETHTFNIYLSVNEPSNQFNINIKDKDMFIDKMYEYINLLLIKNMDDKTDMVNKIIRYLTLVWSNATYEDLENPEMFLEKYINFENNKLFESQVFTDSIYELNDSNIEINISNQTSNFETPYLFNVIITDGSNNYYLPSISYGISNDCCYIYAIQNKKTFSNNLDYEKKIKRILYKINENVFNNETDEYKEYKAGNTYYPENISDVSPSTVISLTCFLKSLVEKNITKVKVVSFLPIRYYNKEICYQKKFLYKSKNVDDKEIMLRDLELEHLHIQKNLTEKLIRNFRRMAYHFSNIDILSLPMDLDEYMHLRINPFTISNNKLLNNILNHHIEKNNKTK